METREEKSSTGLNNALAPSIRGEKVFRLTEQRGTTGRAGRNGTGRDGTGRTRQDGAGTSPSRLLAGNRVGLISAFLRFVVTVTSGERAGRIEARAERDGGNGDGIFD